MAKKCLIVKATQASEVSGAAGQSLPALRPQPGVHAEVRRLPHLFPRAGVGWSPAWRDEVELVTVQLPRTAIENKTRRAADECQ